MNPTWTEIEGGVLALLRSFSDTDPFNFHPPDSHRFDPRLDIAQYLPLQESVRAFGKGPLNLQAWPPTPT